MSDETLQRLGHFAWHWACQCTDARAFWQFLYCCALYNFFFLGFRQWHSLADRVVNLNTTIRLPLFWRTWTQARARTRPHVLAWHMGRDYSYCRASELTDRQVSGFFFFLISRKYRKKEGLTRDFSKAHAQDWFGAALSTSNIVLFTWTSWALSGIYMNSKSTK